MIWLLLYAAFIAHLSLYPWHFEASTAPLMERWTGFAIHTRGDLMDSIANVVLYLPLGFAAYRRFGSMSAAVLAGVIFSGGMEWAQLYTPNRNSSLRDMFCNGMGAWAGTSMAIHFPVFPKAQTSRSALQPVASLFLACWALWMIFPFFPILRMGTFVRAWQQMIHPEPAGFLETGDMLLATLTLGYVLEPGPWLLAGWAVLPLQGLFLNQTLSLARVILGSLGAGFARFVPRPPYWLASALCIWLVVRELYPFHFQAVPSAFSWTPFESLFSNARDTYYRTTCGKLFLYLAAVWSLRACGFSWLRTGLIPMTIAFCGEWGQRYLPGRTPEMTEPALAGITFVLLRMVGFRIEVIHELRGDEIPGK